MLHVYGMGVSGVLGVAVQHWVGQCGWGNGCGGRTGVGGGMGVGVGDDAWNAWVCVIVIHICLKFGVWLFARVCTCLEVICSLAGADASVWIVQYACVIVVTMGERFR